jgi:hypothetical protein
MAVFFAFKFPKFCPKLQTLSFSHFQSAQI